MVKLIRMTLTVIGAALLNKVLKGSLWPSTNSEHSGNQQNHLKALQNAILALLLSRSRGSWIIQPAAISTVGALFAAFMSSMNRDHESKDQIIETNEYKIVDEIENRAPEGYKVVIDDGR
jgi:hypothetical protein